VNIRRAITDDALAFIACFSRRSASRSKLGTGRKDYSHAIGSRTAFDPCAAFSPDSRFLANADRRLEIWDTATRDLVASAPLADNTGTGARAPVFSPESRLIATAEGEAARVWHVPRPHRHR
jgi:WD40 repeat protein